MDRIRALLAEKLEQARRLIAGDTGVTPAPPVEEK